MQVSNSAVLCYGRPRKLIVFTNQDQDYEKESRLGEKSILKKEFDRQHTELHPGRDACDVQMAVKLKDRTELQAPIWMAFLYK